MRRTYGTRARGFTGAPQGTVAESILKLNPATDLTWLLDRYIKVFAFPALLMNPKKSKYDIGSHT